MVILNTETSQSKIHLYDNHNTLFYITNHAKLNLATGVRKILSEEG